MELEQIQLDNRPSLYQIVGTNDPFNFQAIIHNTNFDLKIIEL